MAYRGAAEVWTYTHATHFRRKAPRRYPKRVVPPGIVAPLFAPPPLEDIVRVEEKFYDDWSPETRQLLADGDALVAYKRRAFDLYRQRFAPEALLRRVDAWNERGAPDGWQDTNF